MMPERVYVTSTTIRSLLGVERSKAYQIIRNLNALAVENGQMSFPNGKANKYDFAEKFGIPQEVVNEAIRKEEEDAKTAAEIKAK